jgi:hypothetical protein
VATASALCPELGLALFSGILMLRVLPCFAERCHFQENSPTLNKALPYILVGRIRLNKEKHDQRSHVAVLAE